LRNQFTFFTLIVYFSLSGLFAQEAAEPVTGGQLRLGYVFVQPPAFNPMIARTDYEQEINNLIFGDGLLRKTGDDRIVHAIAYPIRSDQNKIWRVNLRSNIFFHDGSPITAEDIKFSFDLYKKFALQSPLLFDTRLISTIDIIDDKNLSIILKVPYTKFRETIGLLPILPKKRYERWLSFNLLGGLPEISPLGNGNYYLDRKNDSQINLKTYTNHYRGRSHLDGITFIFYSNYEEMVDAYIKGQIDVMVVQSASTVRKIKRLTPSTKIESVRRDDVKLYYILLNTRSTPFNDANIRRAFNYGVYKKQLVDKMLGKDGEVAYNLLKEQSEFNFPGARVYRYDPLQSLEILNSSGFRQQSNGKLFQRNRELRFEFYYTEGSSFEESIARMISINLAELGINIIPKPLSAEKLERFINQGKYQAALRTYVYNMNNPVQALRGFYLDELKTENNFQNFNNRVMNTAITQIEKVSNIQQSEVIMQQMQVQINQLSPCIYLFFENLISYAMNERLENVKNRIRQKLVYVDKINPKNEWYIPKQKQKN
jgi:peptide/nickel transport system substrate-binding protein